MDSLIDNAKPILFNTEMVRAILSDKKTVTRRPIKYNFQQIYKAACYYGKWYESFGNELPQDIIDWYVNWYRRNIVKHKYRVGDTLYVRETFKIALDGYTGIKYGGYIYKADTDSPFNDPYNPWKPSIHMPKSAARIFIKITSVGIERLNDIADEVDEIVKEGIESTKIWDHTIRLMQNGFYKDFKYLPVTHAFIRLWNGTLKKSDKEVYGWDANPWVEAYTFERIEVNK